MYYHLVDLPPRAWLRDVSTHIIIYIMHVEGHPGRGGTVLSVSIKYGFTRKVEAPAYTVSVVRFVGSRMRDGVCMGV